jgi:uncharacterized protein YigE (DUF2233 family)
MKVSRRILALGVSVAVLVLGFTAWSAWPRDSEPPPCSVRTFEGSRFTVCVFDARSDDLMLASRDAEGVYLRGFDRLSTFLGSDAARVRFAMNAGMYDDRGAPIGLYIADGAQERRINLNDGPGNFHMMPNGVFWQSENGEVHVSTSEAYAAEARATLWATQSGPMLVIDGALHPRFQDDGPSRYVRNGVGVSGAHTAYFVISSGAVSFGRFARFFRDELGCDDALFLDGSVSSLWAPHMERRDGNQELGPLIAVLARD